MLALINTKDKNHQACRASFNREGPPSLISIAILSEIAWFLEARFPSDVERTVLRDLRRGAYTLDWDTSDLTRIDELTERYRDLGLGLADAAVIACAERHGGKVLTTDRRHFPVVARGEKTISVLPPIL
ncbi:MAG: PIN domain-containing protein [Chloroflexi bacterium]|nr:PIN domain-containing protein [Chloroflexota bacterium]